MVTQPTSPHPLDRIERGSLDEGDLIVGEDYSLYDAFSFEVEAGWTIVVDLRSKDFDAYLWLISPRDVVIQDDDSGGGESYGDLHGMPPTNSRIAHTFTQAGTYTLRANSYDGTGRGAYTLHYVVGPDVQLPTPGGTGTLIP